MARPEFIPVYEQEENVILDRLLARIDDSWRKEQGDFMYDAVATVPAEIKALQVGLDEQLKATHAQYAEGEDMDLLLAEVGLTRLPAIANARVLQIIADPGVVIPTGHTVAALVTDEEGNPIEYSVNEGVTFTAPMALDVRITAVRAGEIANLITGSEFALVPPISGVRVVVDQGTYIKGTEEETDDAAWERYEFKVQNPDTGGNKNDYRRWASEVPGIGRVKVLPRWQGKGTVKVVAIDAQMQPTSPTLTATLQEYLDPGSRGLGEGKAPAGASVTATAADPVAINITADVQVTSGYDPVAVKTTFESNVAAYLRTIALLEVPLPVVYNRVGAIFFNTEGISNYNNLTINGGTTDVAIGEEEVAVLGTVTF